MAKLTKKQILALSDDERKKYYADQLEELRKEEKLIKAELSRKQLAEKAKNRSKVNHGKYIIAGEFLASPGAKAFLENLAKTQKFPARSALGLNLLMAELGFNIKFMSVE
jgi:hypothetical protein